MRRKLRPWVRRVRMVTAAVAVLGAAVATLTPAVAEAGAAGSDQLTDLVNPFIGTQNDGNTYPGATVPFGMVQFSPDTGHNTGYNYTQNHIRGFSLVHLSGVGCPLGGDLPVLPTIGDVTTTDNAKYEAEFSHDNEKASPG
jgi:putative alpha-1,2-mannosidase